MTICTNCSQPIPLGQEKRIIGKKSITTLCPDCITKLNSAISAETENPNIVLSVILALLAAVGSALLWYGAVVVTQYQLGIVAIGVGALVAFAAMFGAGKKRGLAVQIISVIFTILAMVSSEYLIVRYSAVQSLAQEGITNIPLLLPVGTIFELIRIGVSEQPLTLLFWAIAVFEAFRIPMKRKFKYS